MDIYADTFDPTAPTAYEEVKRLTEELKEAHADYARVLAQREGMYEQIGELVAINHGLQEQIRYLKYAADKRIHYKQLQLLQAADKAHLKVPSSYCQSLRL